MVQIAYLFNRTALTAETGGCRRWVAVAAAPMAGGRGCQEQEQQQEGIKGAWDGAAANGGEAERGEGGGARESWLQRKRKEGATAAAPLRRTKH